MEIKISPEEIQSTSIRIGMVLEARQAERIEKQSLVPIFFM